MSRDRPRRVAVLAGSSLGWREKIIRGIAGYAHEHGPWHVYTAPEGTEDSVFFSENYRWDGVIVRVTSDRRSSFDVLYLLVLVIRRQVAIHILA